MLVSTLFQLCLLLLSSFAPSTLGLDTAKYDEMLNTCIDSKYHKSRPGPESELFQQCSQWKKNACCTSNTTENLNQTSLYNFKLDHCPEMQDSLSSSCKAHFVQDMCFYECEPNIGPWRVRTGRSFASERFQDVPLCKSQCDEWFDACRNDYTCVVNWPKDMKFVKGEGNKCPDESPCRIFEEVYKNNASLFCSQVWDGSFRVVPDTEPCMKIFFDGNKGNPNERVAVDYVQKLMKQEAMEEMSMQTTTPGSGPRIGLTGLLFLVSLYIGLLVNQD